MLLQCLLITKVVREIESIDLGKGVVKGVRKRCASLMTKASRIMPALDDLCRSVRDVPRDG